VDKMLILRKLAELETCLQQIGEYRAIALDDYLCDWKTQRIVERTLQIMIELCVDIGQHIIADKRLPVPTGYANAFEVLQHAGLISHVLMDTMIKMTGFRNILVHQYADVDAEIVVAILNHQLDDFVLFRDEIVNQMH
jgi:uncharacterized protein YutE (UPF0331/DUF86 family)